MSKTEKAFNEWKQGLISETEYRRKVKEIISVFENNDKEDK